MRRYSTIRTAVSFACLLFFIAYSFSGVTLTTQEEPPSGGLRFVHGKRLGGPLLLMELGSILRHNGAHVVWVTANKKHDSDSVVASLETKLLKHGLQIMAARGARTAAVVRASDLVILNTAVAGKWMDAMARELGEVKSREEVLGKTLWWIHEMRGHYFAMEYVRHLLKWQA